MVFYNKVRFEYIYDGSVTFKNMYSYIFGDLVVQETDINLINSRISIYNEKES